MNAVNFFELDEKEFESFFKKSNEDYIQEVAKIERISIEHSRIKCENQMASILPNGRLTETHCFYKAVMDSHKVGYLWIQKNQLHKSIFIFQIEVLEEHRGKGYGTKVLESLKAEAIEQGFNHIHLSVFSHNKVAKKLYEKFGFKEKAVSMVFDL